MPARVNEPHSKAFRPDIEGLRAVAILLVLLYHASLPFLPGGFIGVDVFFVISGFLITSLLVREAERTGKVSLRRFYARRAKRLLPASALVLVVTSALTVWLINGSDRRAFGLDISAAAGYVVNWRLAARAVDYLAEGTGQSPVLHFWSLAVEEQFYFVWPFLIIVALFVAHRLRWSMRRTMTVALSVVAIPSFIASILQTASNPATAFFVTTTRLWELAVGAFVAIAATRFARLPERAASAISVTGLVVILASAVLLTDTAAWPGYLAAIPVLGAAAVIAGGIAHPHAVAARVLALRPMVWIGGLSYSLYLWHWPMLIFGQAAFGPLRVREQMALAVLSIVPAYLSMRFIENPARYSKRLARGSALALATGAALTLAGVAAGFAVALTAPSPSSNQTIVIEVPEGTATGEGSGMGAQALGNDPTSSPAGIPQDSYETIVPEPASAADDVPASYDLGCQAAQDSTEIVTCPVGALDSKIVVAAVGDSKMLQWYTALDIAGRNLGVRFEFMTKSSCESTDAITSISGAAYTTCKEFNEAVDRKILDGGYAGVLTSGGVPHVTESSPLDAVEGYTQRWERWQQAGIPVTVVLDNPHPPGDVYPCMEKNADSALTCAFERAHGIESGGAPGQTAAAEASGAAVIDLTDFICPQEQCAPVIGNVLILRQGSHLTNTYVITLAPQLIRELAPRMAALGATG
ncbi:MAG: acyltransferase [Demequina sp.]|nr:acyltransferase [Demequina sp.]